MFKTLVALLKDENGQGLAEYGLILALVAAVCVASIETLGNGIDNALSEVNDYLP